MFIPVAEPKIGKAETKNVLDCLRSGWISSIGRYVQEFENGFASYCDCKYGVATSNGTTALHLALKVLGVKGGDEVIVPDLTFVATANAVIYCGAKPVCVDIDPLTWNIDPEKIEKKITSKTKAIIPVHLCGMPADMLAIRRIAKEYDLAIIEDAAEAHGAEYFGRKVGSLSEIGCFSFYANKVITTGEGGMCVTSNKALAEKLRFLRDHAMSKTKRYWHSELGYNYRITNLQSAIGCAQLGRINEFIKAKIRNAEIYTSLLQGVPGITFPVKIQGFHNVYWMYCLLIEEKFGISRDELIIKLKKRGIDSRRFFYPLHALPMYKSAGKFPVSDEIAKKGIMLPSSVTLKAKDIAFIAKAIKQIQAGR